MSELDSVIVAAESLGLAFRGGFHPSRLDRVPGFSDGAPAGTVLLFGFIGRGHWSRFVGSAEYADGEPDPLDRWSRRSIEDLGVRFGARGLYPSDGPPWWPFQRWAQRSEAVHPSPLGILIHPDYGLWHAYRGALAFPARLELPPADDRCSPCDACVERPCLSVCPIGAVTASRYDHAGCRTHVGSRDGAACLNQGCLARRACPVGAEYRYDDAESRFHMAAFVGC